MITRFEIGFRSYLPWLLLAVVYLGCASQSESGSGSSNARSMTAKHTGGNVELTAIIEREDVRLSEDVKLTLSVRKPTSVRVEFPNLAGQLDDFSVSGTQDTLPVVDGEMQIVQRVYQLQPKRPGEISLVLPPVYFSDSADDPSERQFVEVDPIDLTVATEASIEDKNLESLRQAVAPIDLPESKAMKLAVWIGLAAAVIAVGIVIGMLLFSSIKKRKSLPLSPRQIALRDLQKLIDSRLAANDSKLYYVELTGIVRRYIEGCTTIRAPELTTQEFLHEISSTGDFPDQLRLSLKAFLESADLIKFAGQEPSEQELTGSLQRAREFIDTQWASGGVSA